eukprot:1158715-Pelagomonas_calceolata.AAC.3
MEVENKDIKRLIFEGGRWPDAPHPTPAQGNSNTHEEWKAHLRAFNEFGVDVGLTCSIKRTHATLVRSAKEKGDKDTLSLIPGGRGLEQVTHRHVQPNTHTHTHTHTWPMSLPLVGMGLCTTIRTEPGRRHPSWPEGMRSPVPKRVTGTTSTPALPATLNAPFLNPAITLQIDSHRIQTPAMSPATRLPVVAKHIRH